MVWRTRSIEAFGAIEAAQSEDELFEVLVDYAKGFDAELVSYHHVVPSPKGFQISDAAERRNFYARGFPDVWVKAYRERGYHRIDPITSFAAYQTRPIRWSQVTDRIAVTPEQREYLDVLWSWLSPGDGMAVPLFGPSGRHGYIGMGSTRPLAHWEGHRVRIVGGVCESFHLRFCELRLAGLPMDFELTERELEVLGLMARGHADWLIGAVTGAAPERVEALVESILTKMGVIDRPSALIRARGLGLIG